MRILYTRKKFDHKFININWETFLIRKFVKNINKFLFETIKKFQHIMISLTWSYFLIDKFILIPKVRIYTIQLKSLNIALNNYFTTDYPDSKQYGGIRDGPTDFKSEDIFCYTLGPKYTNFHQKISSHIS